jgi:hypothetical protein
VFTKEVEKRAFKNMYPAAIRVSYNRSKKAWLDPRMYDASHSMIVRIIRYCTQSDHISVPFSLDNRESQILWGKVIESHWNEKRHKTS